MGAISQVIPNLLGGVSQQPDPVKLPGQVRECINAYLDPTFGTKKRPPTRFIGLMGNNIPEDAKWFPILKDETERYVVAIYTEFDAPIIRVWDLLSGDERTVTIGEGARDYLEGSDLHSINTLSLADYTLVSNSNRIVTMSDVNSEETTNSGLVIINAVAYNTNYSIDLSSDSSAEKIKVYKAKKLSVSPGSYVDSDDDSCSQQDAQDFTVDHPTDESKTGLVFRLTNLCTSYLQGGSYRSRYNVKVTLRNGGEGWRTGDTVTVTMKNKEFTVTVEEEKFIYTYADDGTAVYTSPVNSEGGTLSVADIVTGLSSEVSAIEGYTAESVGNVLRITREDDRAFNIAVRGGSTNKAMYAIKGTASDVSELPGQCFDGFQIKVANTQESDADDYYVEFKADSAGIPGQGAWEEVVANDIPISLNPSTMPHALVREDNGNFEFKPLGANSALGGWASRDVGDVESNPTPTFVGRSISNMFFHANRLGFLSGDAVIMSQPGDYFNFFVTSALKIADSDPIDMTTSSTNPAKLLAATGTPKGLVLFAEDAQFLLSSADYIFSPNNVKITEISNYHYNSDVEPISTGVSMLFVSEADTYAKVFEMAVDSVDNRPQVSELTRICPEYVPPHMLWGTGCPNNSFTLFGDRSNTIWMFKFFQQGNERAQAGWCKWVMPGDVYLAAFENDTGYFVLKDGDKYVLADMEILDDPDQAPIDSPLGKFTPRLDLYTISTDMTVTANDELTQRVYLQEGQYLSGTTIQYICTGGSAENNSAGTYRTEEVLVDEFGAPYIVVENSLIDLDPLGTVADASNFIVGTQYEMTVELPAFFIQNEGKADRVDIPVVEMAYIDLYYSSSYFITLSRLGYDDVEFEMTVPLADAYNANTVPVLETITKPIPVMCPGDVSRLTIKATDPLPAALTGYSWQGHYNKRGIRVI